MPLAPNLLNKAMDSGVLLDTLSFIDVIDISGDQVVQRQIQNSLQQKTTVVFTSSNAVHAVCNHEGFTKPDWQICCIEKATKKAVLDYFAESDIICSADNSEELAARVKVLPGLREVIFFCGDKRMDTLPVTLLDAGIITNEITVYKTVERAQFIEKEYDAILFYSPSGVSSFFSMNMLPAGTVLFAIGNTTAQALKIETDNKVIISDTPSKEILLYKAISYFKENTNS